MPGVFRIDHDQAFQQTTNLRYQRGKDGLWGAFIWRYDSGLVVTGVPDCGRGADADAAQQVDIGLACNGVPATFGSPLRSCGGAGHFDAADACRRPERRTTTTTRTA